MDSDISMNDTPNARNLFSDAIFTMSYPDLNNLFSDLISVDRRPSQHFVQSLDQTQHTQVLRACLLVFLLSNGKVVPRDFQLEAALGSLAGRDGIIVSGTASGKTLIMIIQLLLRPTELSILIVPLKRLQQAHLEAFTSFGIPTVVINEDTPNDCMLWKRITEGYYQNIITTMEQLGIFDGHMTKFASLLRSPDRKFINLVKRLQIDEAQTIYTDGIAKHGQPPFRPAYGRFDVFRLLFSKGTTATAFSATLPPHMLQITKKKMTIGPNYLFLRRTSNRPNIMYATHQIVGTLSDFRNLNLPVPPADSCSPATIPLSIVFHDDIKECSGAAHYVDKLLPPALQGTGLVRHYHSGMSQEYLENVYQAFQSGTCRILHTCAGMESGIDVNKSDRVLNLGVVSNSTKSVQRGGRGGRNPKDRS